jgi:hypothetical protein
VCIDVAAGLSYAAVEHLSAGLGLYWAVATATTVGYGDVTPHTPTGHIIAVVTMLTAIPLWSATFSLFTSGLMAGQVNKAEDRIKQHTEDRLANHHKQIRAACGLPPAEGSPRPGV